MSCGFRDALHHHPVPSTARSGSYKSHSLSVLGGNAGNIRLTRFLPVRSQFRILKGLFLLCFKNSTGSEPEAQDLLKNFVQNFPAGQSLPLPMPLTIKLQTVCGKEVQSSRERTHCNSDAAMFFWRQETLHLLQQQSTRTIFCTASLSQLPNRL